jgi:hypothetical protein
MTTPKPDLDGRDHYARLASMMSDRGETWDLSDNDRAAIEWGLNELARIGARLARAERAERERDALQRHYDAAAPEHNLLALLDLYEARERTAEARLARAEEALRWARCFRCGAVKGTHGRPCITDADAQAWLDKQAAALSPTDTEGDTT